MCRCNSDVSHSIRVGMYLKLIGIQQRGCNVEKAFVQSAQSKKLTSHCSLWRMLTSMYDDECQVVIVKI